MYYLDCERILLHPLSANHLYWFARDFKKLEKALNLEPNPMEFGEFEEFEHQLHDAILTSVIPAVKQNMDQYMWYTHWLIIHREKRIIIGGIGIQGEPDRNSEVFLNFYEDTKFQESGFIKEALHCIARWLIKTGRVRAIKVVIPNVQVETQEILEKSGFNIFKKRIKETEWVYEG